MFFLFHHLDPFLHLLPLGITDTDSQSTSTFFFMHWITYRENTIEIIPQNTIILFSTFLFEKASL